MLNVYVLRRTGRGVAAQCPMNSFECLQHPAAWLNARQQEAAAAAKARDDAENAAADERAMNACLQDQGNMPASVAISRCRQRQMTQRRDSDLAEIMAGCQTGAVNLPL
jgi:hypothetical protein